MLVNILWVSLGAVMGASLRYLVGLLLAKMLYHSAYSTLLVNLIGSFILGLLMLSIAGGKNISEPQRLLWGIGFCGSLTTFSAFAWDGWQMLNNHYFKFALHVFLNLFGTLAMIGLAKWILSKVNPI